MAPSSTRAIATWSLVVALLALAFSPAVSESLAVSRPPRPYGHDPEQLAKYPGLVTAYVRDTATGPVLTTVRYTLQQNGGVASIVVTAVQNTRVGSEAQAEERLAAASDAAERATASALSRLAQQPGSPLVDVTPLLDDRFSEAVAELVDAPYPRVKSATCRPGQGLACENVLEALARSASPAA